MQSTTISFGISEGNHLHIQIDAGSPVLKFVSIPGVDKTYPVPSRLRPYAQVPQTNNTKSVPVRMLGTIVFNRNVIDRENAKLIVAKFLNDINQIIEEDQKQTKYIPKREMLCILGSSNQAREGSLSTIIHGILINVLGTNSPSISQLQHAFAIAKKYPEEQITYWAKPYVRKTEYEDFLIPEPSTWSDS